MKPTVNKPVNEGLELYLCIEDYDQENYVAQMLHDPEQLLVELSRQNNEITAYIDEDMVRLHVLAQRASTVHIIKIRLYDQSFFKEDGCILYLKKDYKELDCRRDLGFLGRLVLDKYNVNYPGQFIPYNNQTHDKARFKSNNYSNFKNIRTSTHDEEPIEFKRRPTTPKRKDRSTVVRQAEAVAKGSLRFALAYAEKSQDIFKEFSNEALAAIIYNHRHEVAKTFEGNQEYIYRFYSELISITEKTFQEIFTSREISRQDRQEYASSSTVKLLFTLELLNATAQQRKASAKPRHHRQHHRAHRRSAREPHQSKPRPQAKPKEQQQGKRKEKATFDPKGNASQFFGDLQVKEARLLAQKHHAASTNAYQILDVDKNANAAQIRKAYLKKVKAAHTDRGGDKDAMQELNAARDVLKEPESRRVYDATLERLQVKASAASTPRYGR